MGGRRFDRDVRYLQRRADQPQDSRFGVRELEGYGFLPQGTRSSISRGTWLGRGKKLAIRISRGSNTELTLEDTTHRNRPLPTGSGPVKIAKDLEESQGGGRKAKRPRAYTVPAKKEPLS